jgi:hypothetical protein
MSEPKLLPTKEQIERRAYDLYLERGGEHGNDLKDWFAAERELTEMSQPAASSVQKARAAASARAGRTAREGPVK